jgi:hypothetical protein
MIPNPVFHAIHERVSLDEMHERMSKTPARKLINAKKIEVTFMPRLLVLTSGYREAAGKVY